MDTTIRIEPAGKLEAIEAFGDMAVMAVTTLYKRDMFTEEEIKHVARLLDEAADLSSSSESHQEWADGLRRRAEAMRSGKTLS